MEIYKPLTQEIKQFIRTDTTNDSKLRIDFDRMCINILSKFKVEFSQSELERSLVVELKKLEGELISDEIFDAISLYVAKKVIWLHMQNKKDQDIRTKEIRWVNEVTNPQERSERMAEIYRRRTKRKATN